MARIYKMTWVPSRRGWMKEYKGRKYAVSCRQLGEQLGITVPETKDGSYQTANAWWEKKKKELDEASKPIARALLPLEDVTAALFAGDVHAFDDPSAVISAVRGDEQVEFPLPVDMPVFFDPKAKRLLEGTPEPAIQAAIRVVALRLMERYILGREPLPESLAQALPPARVQQVQDSVAGIRGEATAPAERTVAANCERWVALQQAKVAGGKLAPDRADCLRIHLNHFRDFLGGTAAVDTVDAQKVEGFYQWCMGKVQERQKDKDGKAGWSAIYAKKVFDTARVFVRYLWESGLIELPRNIDSREFGFRVGAKVVQFWTAEEFQNALATATGQLRLHLLLMANCGFTQEDISDLLDKEVDWQAGRIIRKRSKTRDQENVPVVNYLLWPSASALLREYRSGQERVLLTESGGVWKRKELNDGEFTKSDNIASCYTWLKKKLKGFKKPLKWLRKTGATLLDSQPEYTRFSVMYLGHSPQGVKDRYYSAPDQRGFDEAILWLGQQLGQVPVEDSQAEPAQQTRRRKGQSR